MRRVGLAWLLGVVAVSAPSVPAAEEQVHVVRAGETLWQIAEEQVGDAYRWSELYRANRDQIKDPGMLYVGQRLKLPGPDSYEAEPSVSGAAPEVASPPPE